MHFPQAIYRYFTSLHFDVRMTSYKNSIIAFGFRIQKYPKKTNLSNIKPISCQICKFLHFSIPRHIHNKRLRSMRIFTICKMTPIGVRLNLKNFFLISCGVTQLSRKVSRGGGGERGIRSPISFSSN